MLLKKTARGFGLIEFTDLYGESGSLQKSSLATDDAVWFGLDEPKFHPITGECLGGRVHLNREQVAALLPYLIQFVETGEIGPLAEDADDD